MKLLTLSPAKVTDTATGTLGSLKHAIIESDGQVSYNFQPEGLNTKDGTPLEWSRLKPNRIKDGVEKEYDVPVEVLNTRIKHDPTGFEGICTDIFLFSTGCCHFVIAPSTRNKETNELTRAHDFPTQECSGAAIKKLTPKEKEVEQKKKPGGPSVLQARAIR